MATSDHVDVNAEASSSAANTNASSASRVDARQSTITAYFSRRGHVQSVPEEVCTSQLSDAIREKCRVSAAPSFTAAHDDHASGAQAQSPIPGAVAAGPHNDPEARAARKRDAAETFSILPYLLQHSFDPIESAGRTKPIGATAKCIPYHHPTTSSSSTTSSTQSSRSSALHALHQHRNPHHGPCTIRVLNEDSLDAALSLGAPVFLPVPPRTYRDVARPALLLNLASGAHPGGGWRTGAKAQEESICYRSTLASALPTRASSLGGRGAYPWRGNELFLHPCVAVFRDSMARGHALLPDLLRPERLRFVAVVSAAALKDPPVQRVRTVAGGERFAFKRTADRDLTRDKIRAVCRLAGREGYTRLVLGAFGCGAYNGPCEEVAGLFREVLEDGEFRGWFEDVVFAVMSGRSSDDEDNFDVFRRVLDGVVVGGGGPSRRTLPVHRAINGFARAT